MEAYEKERYKCQEAMYLLEALERNTEDGGKKALARARHDRDEIDQREGCSPNTHLAHGYDFKKATEKCPIDIDTEEECKQNDSM